MRLIDADELYRKITDYCYGAVDKSVAKRMIEQMPTIEPPAKCIAKVQFDEDKMREIVDEVIVHCKDCKHYIYDGDRWLCKVLSNNYEPIVDLDSDGFCSYGERRTDEGNNNIQTAQT